MLKTATNVSKLIGSVTTHVGFVIRIPKRKIVQTVVLKLLQLKSFARSAWNNKGNKILIRILKNETVQNEEK